MDDWSISIIDSLTEVDSVQFHYIENSVYYHYKYYIVLQYKSKDATET